MAQTWGFGPAAPNGNLFPGPGDPGFGTPTQQTGWPSAQAPGLFGPLQNTPWQTPAPGPQAGNGSPGNMMMIPGLPQPSQQGGAGQWGAQPGGAMMPSMPAPGALGSMLGGSGMHYAPGDPLAAAQNPFATGGQGAGANFSGTFLPGGAPRQQNWLSSPMAQTRAWAGGNPNFSESGNKPVQQPATLGSVLRMGSRSGRGYTFS